MFCFQQKHECKRVQGVYFEVAMVVLEHKSIHESAKPDQTFHLCSLRALMLEWSARDHMGMREKMRVIWITPISAIPKASDSL